MSDTNQLPESVTNRHDHSWGFKDSGFEVLEKRVVKFTGDRYELCGYEIPGLIPFIEEIFDVKLDLSKPKPTVTDVEVAEPNHNHLFTEAVTKALSEAQVSVDDRVRLIHSHGQTTADEVYKVLYGELDRVCDIVVYPTNTEEAARVVEAAAEHNVCLVPYGGGTSVSCALQLPTDEERTICVIDTRRMNKILWVDEGNLKAGVQAGICGGDLEVQLAEVGLTCGHEPDSIEFSTLGGWIATNASGMKKNRYGNIDSVVESVTMVTPGGQVSELASQARTSIGIQPKHLSIGSEGNLGLITEAVINVHPVPPKRRYDSLVFRNFETGVAFLRELSKSKVLPASIRLVDNIQFRSGQALKPRQDPIQKFQSWIQKTFLTKVKRFDLTKMAAATIMMEGSEAEVSFQNREVKKLAESFGAVVGGATNGKRGYMLTYAIAYIRDFLNTYDVIGETYETTVPWDRVTEVCDAVTKRAVELHNEFNLPGRPYVSPRVTQTYNTGVCIYFTHGFCCKGIEHPDELFGKIEIDLRQTILDHGGSLSHHHGIGKLRKQFMNQVLSEEAIATMGKIKHSIDPDDIFGIDNNVM